MDTWWISVHCWGIKKKHQNPKINVSTASKFEVHFGHNSFFFPRNPNFNNSKTSKLKQITSRSYKKINKFFLKKDLFWFHSLNQINQSETCRPDRAPFPYKFTGFVDQLIGVIMSFHTWHRSINSFIRINCKQDYGLVNASH